MTATATPAAGDSRRDRAVELAATVLLAIAAVTTAWSSYQATRWNGEQAKASSRANALRISAARSQGLAQAQTQVDVATFIQWVNARAQGSGQLEQFYVDRFREEFRPAFDAWLDTAPLTTPGAPNTPFELPEYRLEAAEDAERFDAQAATSVAQVTRNIQRSSNYVLGVVLCSIALFFGGMSAKLRRPALRFAMLFLGWALFLATASWLATFPITFAISA